MDENTRVNVVLSLQELCVQTILHSRHVKLASVEGTLVIYDRIRNVGWPSFAPLRIELMKRIQNYFPILLQRADNLDDLKNFFLPDDWTPLEQSVRSMDEAKRRMSYLKGSILEREKPAITELSDYYPLEALLQGLEWPSNVDPANREKCLTDEVFVAVFGRTKESFYQLGKHDRIRLKKEHGLF
jgi:hypothetical protein